MVAGVSSGASSSEELKYNELFFQHLQENANRNMSVSLLTMCDLGVELRGNFLDVGFGTVDLMEELVQRGCRSYGIDPYSEQTSKVADLKKCTLTEADYPADFFDLIYMGDVIEHIGNADVYIRECFRILKQSGVLVIKTPDSGSLMARLVGKRWRDLIQTHTNLIDKKMLFKLLRQAGFSIGMQISWGAGITMKANKLRSIIYSISKVLNIGDQIAVAAYKPGRI